MILKSRFNDHCLFKSRTNAKINYSTPIHHLLYKEKTVLQRDAMDKLDKYLSVVLMSFKTITVALWRHRAMPGTFFVPKSCSIMARSCHGKFWTPYHGLRGGGGGFNIKMPSYQFRKSHCEDKTFWRPSYLHNGNSYTGKTAYLYWIRVLVIDRITDSSCLISRRIPKVCIFLQGRKTQGTRL